MGLPEMLGSIHCGDCIRGMQRLETGCVDLVFADPPFNIGYEYDEYDDCRDSGRYLGWTREWMAEVSRILKPKGTFWLAIGDEYAAELKLLAEKEAGFTCRSWVVWYYTFGVNCTRKFNRSHVHLFHFVKDPNDFVFNSRDRRVRVPSARELVYRDKRANPRGRLPDDTWILRPQDLPGAFSTLEDTWYFPRVAGTFKERAGFHGCQMPEQLLGRIVLVSSNEGDLVVDPFAGSAASLVVAKKLGREWLGFELSRQYAAHGRERVQSVFVGEALAGPADPTLSAPATARRSRAHRQVRGGNGRPHAPADSRDFDCGVARTVSGDGAKETSHFDRGIAEAFRRASSGFSSDRVLADPELNEAFIEQCRHIGLPGQPVDFNRRLLRMRKAGRLNVTAARRTGFPEHEMEQYLFASEIATRRLDDLGYRLDDVLCDPGLGRIFDDIASSFAPGHSALEYRWGALRVRKSFNSRRASSQRLPAEFRRKRGSRRRPIRCISPGQVPDSAGVYLIEGGQGKELYFGESTNLRRSFERQFAEELAPGWMNFAELSFGFVALPDQHKARMQYHLIEQRKPELNYMVA